MPLTFAYMYRFGVGPSKGRKQLPWMFICVVFDKKMYIYESTELSATVMSLKDRQQFGLCFGEAVCFL